MLTSTVIGKTFSLKVCYMHSYLLVAAFHFGFFRTVWLFSLGRFSTWRFSWVAYLFSSNLRSFENFYGVSVWLVTQNLIPVLLTLSVCFDWDHWSLSVSWWEDFQSRSLSKISCFCYRRLHQASSCLGSTFYISLNTYNIISPLHQLEWTYLLFLGPYSFNLHV